MRSVIEYARAKPVFHFFACVGSCPWGVGGVLSLSTVHCGVLAVMLAPTRESDDSVLRVARFTPRVCTGA